MSGTETAARGDPAGVTGREYVHSNLARAHALFHVPSAFERDGWLHLTGVIAAFKPEDGSDRTPGFRRALGQIGEVLALAGGSWNDVVSITSYHLDIGADIPSMAAVKDSLRGAPYPAWSVVGAASLADPAGFCEIVAVARLDR
jgi:enamine deaminase RidA (YjgF/YER057c/UK114 family)